MKNLKKIHKILLFVGIFVTIIVAKSQVEEVYANNSVVCNPVLIRKCSICGNNYDNSEECPHHVNEMYHGDICSPTPGRICNICGGNYDDGTICHHHKGNIIMVRYVRLLGFVIYVVEIMMMEMSVRIMRAKVMVAKSVLLMG